MAIGNFDGSKIHQRTIPKNLQWTKSSRANFGGAIFDLFLLIKSIVLRCGTSLGPKLRTYGVGFSKFNKVGDTLTKL